jgi:serine/threonine protein kinase/Tol biopolymer transport system component
LNSVEHEFFHGGPAVIAGMVASFRIVEHLGRQEAGELYKAQDLRDGRLVILEVFPGRPAAAVEQLRQEAEAAAGLGHPHICTVLEVGASPEGSVYVVRSLDEGETLYSRMECGPLAPEHAVGLASQIAAALGRAHESGIVHGDLRPGNVLVTAGGQVRVSGFGLSRILPADGSCPPPVAAYRSPEQLLATLQKPAGATGARSDIWSLGVLLYQMVTGRHPFRGIPGVETDDLVSAILACDPEPMSAVNPGLPPELDEAVARALAKNPADRPARMDDFLVALRGILAGGGLTEVDSTVVQVPGLRDSRPAAAEPFEELEPAGDPEPAGSSRPASRPSRPSRTLAEPHRRRAADVERLGTTVAQYRIVGLLGGGSMGTVYQAEDTRLRRTVALKFLSVEVSGDPQAKARFFQEAQAASALDHPNICTIHEVGETADGHLFLAMASYDGETVRARMSHGPMPVAEALEIARQAALGLAKAHRGGIVHRDVKPANLIVTGDGVVKVLDFGVAKLRNTGGVNLAGSFLGTPAYMSPEQARGEEVDSRADVWSLGVVLYEMLTGVRPFQGGDDLTVVLRSLLEDRPEPPSRLRPEVTPELDRIVARMLARSPAERYPSAAEALADLSALQTALAGPAPMTLRRRAGLWAAALVLAIALSAGGFLVLERPAGPVHATFSQVTNEEGRESYPTISPDGLSAAYVRSMNGQEDIFVRKLADGEPVNLTEDSPDDDTQPAFSPDGKWIAFRSEREGGGIWLLPSTGGAGAARRIAGFGYNPAWSPDGREIAVATEGIVEPIRRMTRSAIWIVDLTTGRRRELVHQEDDGVQPSWSPRGLRIAYWGLLAQGGRRSLWTVPTGGGKPVKTLDDGFLNWNPVWSPDGRYLYFGSDRGGSLNLWRLPIDEESGKVQGDPEAITTPAMGSGFWSVSRDGRRMIYAANESKANVERFPLDAGTLQLKGPSAAVTSGSHMIRSCDISPDGRWIAFYSVVPREDLFVVRTDGSGLRQLTEDAFKDRHPFWSPDGRRLLFYSNRAGQYDAWVLRLDDGSAERVLPPGSKPLTFPIWSPDGRRIAGTYDGDHPAVIDLTQPLQDRRPQFLPPASAQGETFYPTSWSKDGESLAGNISRLDDSMTEGIGVYLVRSRTYLRWTSRGSNPVWLQDGRRLLYIEAGKVLAFDSRTYETREILAPPPSSAYLSASTSPDGRSLFAVRAVEEGDIWLLAQDGDKQGG